MNPGVDWGLSPGLGAGLPGSYTRPCPDSPRGLGQGGADTSLASSPSLRRMYVINREICVRTVCAHEELLRGRQPPPDL